MILFTLLIGRYHAKIHGWMWTTSFSISYVLSCFLCLWTREPHLTHLFVFQGGGDIGRELIFLNSLEFSWNQGWKPWNYNATRLKRGFYSILPKFMGSKTLIITKLPATSSSCSINNTLDFHCSFFLKYYKNFQRNFKRQSIKKKESL